MGIRRDMKSSIEYTWAGIVTGGGFHFKYPHTPLHSVGVVEVYVNLTTISITLTTMGPLSSFTFKNPVMSVVFSFKGT